VGVSGILENFGAVFRAFQIVAMVADAGNKNAARVHQIPTGFIALDFLSSDPANHRSKLR
jgi:hypothetical protein